ncbi:MAG: hypothetical protein AAB508_02750 [Patescibacteria group bacterium]
MSPPIQPTNLKESSADISAIPTANKPILPSVLKILGLILLLVGGYFGYQNLPAVKVDSIVKNCLIKGGSIGESYPPVCIFPTPSSNSPTLPSSFTDLTTNWKIYKIAHDKQSDFSDYEIKLPDSWKVQEHSSNFQDSETFTTTRTTTKASGGDFTPGMGWIFITISDTPISEIVNADENKNSAEMVTVNGLEFTKLSGYGGVAGSVFYANLITSFKEKTYKISLSTQDEDIKKVLLDEFDQILSTFKFIENEILSPSPTPITYLKPPLSDTSSWKSYTLKNIQFKAPQDVLVSISESGAVITEKGGYIPSATIQIGQYDGGSRRTWWINAIKATPDEVSKYMQFQDVQLGDVKALDVFSDGGWWQGGYASPILIANGTTIVSIHGGRGLNPDTGVRNRYIFSDTVASTVKFIQ